MIQFFHDMADNTFLGTGLLAGLLASLACGIIGPYVITRRIVFLSGAIAHMAVGGVGAALFAASVFSATFGWLRPVHGAVLAALAGAVAIGLIHQRVAERMDTLIGALWAVGMTVGILLMKFSPGYQTELMSYLFGNITSVSWDDLQWMAVLDALIAGTVLVFHKRFLALCLDQEQTELQGIHLLGTNLALLCVVALTVIVLTQVVGLILVIALLSLPAATAAHHVSRMGPMMLVSTAIGAAVTTVPRIAVYGTRITPEAAIVLTAAGVYLLSVLISRAAGRARTA